MTDPARPHTFLSAPIPVRTKADRDATAAELAAERAVIADVPRETVVLAAGGLLPSLRTLLAAEQARTDDQAA